MVTNPGVGLPHNLYIAKSTQDTIELQYWYSVPKKVANLGVGWSYILQIFCI